MIVEYTIEEAQLVANLLNAHKKQATDNCELATTALTKIMDADKKQMQDGKSLEET